jgi:SAM-dependent methyltransferase
MLERKASIKNVDSYQGSRLDIIKNIKQSFNVLDVGCNQGATISKIKEKFPHAKCWGIDINSSALSKAMPLLEKGWCLNLDDYSTLKKELSDLHFDTIIAADVLEHTLDPKKVVDILYDNLSEGGTIYISLPNVAHWGIFFHLLNQKWPYRERGIFDNTHYRFFMLKNLYELSPIGSTFVLLDRNYRFFESNKLSQLNVVLSPFIKLLSFFPWIREYFVFQYIIGIKKPNNIT